MKPHHRGIALLALGLLAACSDAAVAIPSAPGRPSETYAPAPGGVRRLLAREYVSSIRVLLGESAALAAAPPADIPLYGFDAIGATQLALSAPDIAVLEASANAVAAAALGEGTKIGEYLTCAPTGAGDAACHAQFIAALGRVAWRRSLDAEEIDRLTAVAQKAAGIFDTFEAGLAAVISALVQSPNFVYVVEIGEPTTGDPDVRELTRGEIVTRMSFLLLGQTPDRALVEEAEAGAEPSDDDLRALAREMLVRPEARLSIRAMYAELFRIRDITDESAVPKSVDLFPNFTGTLRQALQEEVLQLVDHLVWEQDGDFREVLTADYAFVNPELAAFYGMTSPSGDDFEKLPLPEGQGRGGLLGTAAFLARNAHPARTSPTRRGYFVRTTLLCETIQPPPPGVNTKLPADDPEQPQTLKEKLAKHRTDPSCAGCHERMDPIGLAFENYGPVGSYRTLDHGLPIDTAADVPDIGEFESAAELGALLADDERVGACMVKNVLRGALGHLETPGELPVLGELEVSFIEHGYRIQDLLVELVASRAFRFVGAPR